MDGKCTIVLIALVFSALFIVPFTTVTLVRAFNGPPNGCVPPGCNGTITAGTSNNVSVGTTTPVSNVRLLVVGSTTDSTGYGLQILEANSTAILVVRNDGSIGIATTSPAYTLDVNGTIRGTTLLGGLSGTVTANNVTNGVFGSCGTCGGGVYSFPSSLGVATSSAGSLPQSLSVYGGGYFSGSVGIGTTAPGYRLVMSDSSIYGTRLVLLNTNNAATGNFAINAGGTTTGGGNPSNILSFYATANTNGDLGTQVMTLTSGGNVGIGTSTPAYPLHIYGSPANIFLQTTNNYGPSVHFANSVASADWNIGVPGAAGSDSFYIYNGWSGRQVVTILSGANANSLYINGTGVGIATTSPAYALDVNGTIRGTTLLGGLSGTLTASNVTAGVFGSCGTCGSGTYSFPASLGVGTSSAASLPQTLSVYGGGYFSGSVGIGTTAPAGTLDVEGGTAAASTNGNNIVFTAQNAGSGGNNNGGNIVLTPGNAVGAAVGGGVVINGPVGGSSTTLPGTALDIEQTNPYQNGLKVAAYASNNTVNFVDINDSGIPYPAWTYNSYGIVTMTGGSNGNKSQLGIGVGANANYYNGWNSTSTGPAGVTFNSTNSGGGTTGPFMFGIDSREVMRIATSGYVGIGTTAPANPLSVQGNANISGALTVGSCTGCGTGLTGGQANYIPIWTSATAQGTSTIYQTSGNVGIGTAAPSQKLEVTGNVSSTGLCLSGVCSTSWPASGVTSVFGRTGAVVAASGDYTVGQVTGAAPLASPTFTGTVNASQLNVGSNAYTNQAGDIGASRNGASTTGVIYLGSGGTHYLYFDGSNYQMPAGSLYVNGIQAVTNSGTWGINITGTAANITAYTINQNVGTGNSPTFTGLSVGTGKITAGTIDPIYTIGGAEYATYGGENTGVKVDTAGIAQVTCNRQHTTGSARQATCSAVLDFKNADKGSDLWLFYQTTDFGGNMENLAVLLTPSFDGRTWYKKDATRHTLTIYGSSAGEVSYRLTANRFDSAKWPNTTSDSAAGFILPGK